MNNKKVCILLLATCTVLILACGVGVVRGSGKVVTETREVSDFDRVEVHGGGDLYLVQGESESLEIEAEDNIMPYLTSRVVNHTLILEYEDSTRRSFITTREVKYYLTMQDIHGLEISGGGDIDAREIVTTDLETDTSGGGNLKIATLKADEVNMNTSGGGKMEFELLEIDTMDFQMSGGGDLFIDEMHGGTLDVQCSGGSDVRILEGKVRDQRIDMSGGGKYDAAGLQSETVNAELSGGSDLTVWVEQTLDIDASGGGNIIYYGDPTINSSISGGGDIRQRDR